MPQDDLRERENNSGGGIENVGGNWSIGGGSGGGGAYGPEFQRLNGAPKDDQDNQGQDGNGVGDELKDRAGDELKDRAKGKLKGGESATKGAPQGGAQGAGQAGSGAGASAGAGEGAAAAGGAGGGAGAGAGTGAGAGAGAGAAGSGAAGAGAGAAGGGAGAAAGAGAAGAGAAGAGAGAAAAGAGTGAAAGAATAGVAAGGTVAATTGAETFGIGAVVGAAIAVVGVTAGFIIKYKREVAAAGVIAITAVLLLGVVLLNALKPIASTLQTAQKLMSPVQQIVDNRAVEVIGRFITGGSAAAIEAGKRGVAGMDGVVENGKLKTLFDAMKEDGFEDRLKEKYGIEFKPVSNGISISRFGNVVGVATNGRDAAELFRLGFPDLQRMLSEDTPYWSWAQHNKGAINMKGQYDVPTLSVPGGETAYDATQLTDVVKYQMSTILRTGLTNIKRGLSCFVGGTECNNLGVAVSGEAVAEYQNDNRSSLSATTQAAYDENIKGISPDNDYGLPRLDTSAGQKVSEQLDQKTVGLLGWLDIAATTKAMSEKDGAQELPSILRGKQAGSMWLWNVSAINQMLAKDMTSPASSLITRNFQNIEDSQGYNYIAYDDPLRGQGLSETQKINSKLKKAFSYFYESMIIENPILQGTVNLAFKAWLLIHGSIAGTIIDIAARTPLGNFVDRFFAFILDQVGILSFLEQILGISSKALLPVCDPADKTYNFLNCMVSGAHNASNFMCAKFFGCKVVNLDQENELRTQGAKDMQARLAYMPWTKRMFDPKVADSFVNVASLNSPLPIKATSNVATMFQGVFGAVWSAPGKIAALSAAPAKAASSDASLIDGQETMGIPLSDIQTTPLADQLSNDQGICPESKLGEEVNMCIADSSTVDVMTAFHKHDPNYGTNAAAANADNQPAANSGDAAELARQILAKADAGTIKFWKAGAEDDLKRTAEGQKARNGCGGFQQMSADLLYVINEAAKKYAFMITAMNSDHSCGTYHAEGKAVDFDFMNVLGKTPIDANNNLGGTLWRNFASDLARWGLSVAPTVGLGQVQCMGRLNGFDGLTQGNDACNHLHLSVGGSKGSF